MATEDPYKDSTASIADTLKLKASSPGIWGNNLTFQVDKNGINSQVEQMYKELYKIKEGDLFNLTIYSSQAAVETFTCLTVKGDASVPIRLDNYLAQNSSYVLVNGEMKDMKTPKPMEKPSDPFKGGKDSAPLSRSIDYIGDENLRTGIYALENVDIFNILCIPPDKEADDGDKADTLTSINSAAAEYCSTRRAIFISEPLDAWTSHANKGQWDQIQPTDLGINGDTGRYACTYFPKIVMSDPNMNDQERVFSSCGVIAGVMATTDLTRGVWKAPAGQDAGMVGVSDLEVKVNDPHNGILNPLGINCLRNFPVIGPVVWGDRTLRGADLLMDDYKYLSVRRLTNYIEESLIRGTKWAVFEDNDETLWSQLRLSIGAFMKELSVQGAFYNYQVNCDASTTTPDDIAKGVVNVEILFAPVKPAEFVLLKFQQTTATA